MSGMLRQTALLTSIGLRTLGARTSASLVTVISITAVVGVLIALLAIREGTSVFRPAAARTDEALVLSRDAASPLQSALSRDAVASIEQAPGVKKGPDGRPNAYALTAVSVDAMRRDGQRGTVNLLGFTAGWQSVEIDMKLVAGRTFKPALREIMVSDAVRKMYQGFEVGDHITLRGTQWTVVGVFTSADSLNDSALLADAETVMSAFGRSSFAQVTAQLGTAAAFRTFAQSLARDPSLAVEVRTVAEQYQTSFGALRRLLSFIAYFIGAVMAWGAICGTLNSLYSSVNSRLREIATLRALGFGAAPVITSVLIEGAVLALPGALLGALIAWALFNGNIAASGSVVFRLSVTPSLLVLGGAWALAIGLAGGSLPALRAARLPVADALRAA